jgi:uncharacterized protein
MARLIFQTQPSTINIDPNRADVACFVGFVARRNTPVPGVLQQWLTERGWVDGPYRRAGTLPTLLNGQPQFPSLLDVPIPIDSWSLFTALFAWDQRPILGTTQQGVTYLGAAVRSFFAQGGQRCYVVRMGDPWPWNTGLEQRLDRISALVPGYRKRLPGVLEGSPVDRSSWHGITHLFGLPDVAFLALPDLAEAVSVERERIPVSLPILGETPERFVECSQPVPAPPVDTGIRQLPAPTCDQAGYQEWIRALHLVANLLERNQHRVTLRTIQLVAAIPIPQTGSSAEQNLLAFLAGDEALRTLFTEVATSLNGLASKFVQLVYPWVKTPGALNLPQQLESPEGVMTGVLARNTLTRGTYRTIANLPLIEVQDVSPGLPRALVYQPLAAVSRIGTKALIDRVSLLGLTPDGFQVLSDVTTSLEEQYRPASVNRLVAVIIRAARQLGEELVFEASGEYLWTRLENSLQGLLQSLFAAGALSGATEQDAFSVRCDRTTMTQADLDNGRVIVEIQITPAFPIEAITIVLALNEVGQIITLPTLTRQEAA